MVVQLQEHEGVAGPCPRKGEKTHEYICLFLLPLGVSQAGPLQVAANMGGNPGAIRSETGCVVQEILPAPQGNPPRPLVERS